ncbi:hypothetical protein [Isachenkonia alkalipeptolytica]|uniref:Uncharacterized protein n=1 Tax=Isachenkonia alkalipeptolytica TaxID=2565777 RepID=A0AA43XHC0_9CLOT|nr:hypothetical protein [Isachenkonia alkalipeptolytica]NBG86882.1 hypothetical protein [Isachenkonia alkalipeptolytica]
MPRNYVLTSKKLYILLITISFLIMALSLEVLMEVKDGSRFYQWFEEIQQSEGQVVSKEEAFDTYVSGQILLYMLNLVIPLGFALHSFFAFKKERINSLFIYLWMIMLMGGMAFTLISWNVHSLFYYIRIMAYLVLIGTTLSLIRDVGISKKW